MRKLLKYSWVLIVPVMAVAAFVWRASALDHTELLPVPGDCTAFYSVRNGVPILMHCPEGLCFNDELDVCDWCRNSGCVDKKEDEEKDEEKEEKKKGRPICEVGGCNATSCTLTTSATIIGSGGSVTSSITCENAYACCNIGSAFCFEKERCKD